VKYPNVFIDTSAYKVSLFGSNHPFWPAGECIAGLDDLQLGADARSAFLTHNARRLFKLA
jgi:predicted TIM-barrel fold metal-dependent hydrolase